MSELHEQELMDRTVATEDMRILEITRHTDGSGGEIQLCNVDGNLLALRKYEKDSPVFKVVELLAQLLVTGLYDGP